MDVQAAAKKNNSSYLHPVELLQRLIQFDTSNSKSTTDCNAYINTLLIDAGFSTKFFAKHAKYPNLFARLAGQGNAPPLLLYGHVDVVTTDKQHWLHPPFEGKVVNDFMWGRGTLDMKGGVAMMLSAILRAKTEGISLPGDVILLLVSDEENGGNLGAKFMVEQHADLFSGVKHAIGEFGGFSLYVGNQRFYPIMIAEKQMCWLKATIEGPGGHGSLPVHNGAMKKLSKFLQIIDNYRLPVHVTPEACLMFKPMAAALGGLKKTMLSQIMNPLLTNGVLDLLGKRGAIFDPLFHNTVCATMLHGSDKINVIPGEISVELDGRLLPGYSPDDLIQELHHIVGNEVHFEVMRHDPGPSKPNMDLFDTLKQTLQEADPEGIPVPLLLSGVTDGRFFSRLGIQTYGYLPMRLPKNFRFTDTIHAANERIPVDTLAFGTNILYKTLQRFGN